MPENIQFTGFLHIYGTLSNYESKKIYLSEFDEHFPFKQFAKKR